MPPPRTTTSARFMGAGVRYHGRLMTAQQIFARALKTFRVLWFALTVSNLLLGLVTFLVPSRAAHPPDATMWQFFAALGAGLAVASFVVPARMYSRSIAGREPPQITAAEPTPDGSRGAARFAQPELAARAAMPAALTPFILSMALSETVSVLGLQLHMLGYAPTITMPFIVVGTVLAASRFPTVARLVGRYERLHGASFAASEGGSY